MNPLITPFRLSFLLFFIIFLAAEKSFAQSPFSYNKDNSKKKTFYLEILGGASLPSMTYQGNNFQNYNSTSFLSSTEGIGFRMQMNSKFSIATQLAYSGHGTEFAEIENTRLMANYISSYTYAEYEIALVKGKHRVSPLLLLYAGPSISYFANGNVSSTDFKTKLSPNEIATLDYGAETGIGIRIPTFSANVRSNLTLKASYVHGLANTLPQQGNSTTSRDLDQLFMAESGTRNNHAYRIMFVYELALHKTKAVTFTAGGNGKTTYDRFVLVQNK